MYSPVDAPIKARLDTLWWGHMGAFLVHLGWMLAMAVLATTQSTTYDADAYISSAVFKTHTTDVLRTGSIPVHWFPFLFVTLATLHHAGAVLAWDWYRDDVVRGRGWMAWSEYSLSAPVMNVAIAALCGNTQVGEFVGIAVLTSATTWFGWAAEAFASTIPAADSTTRPGEERNVPLINAWRMLGGGVVPFAGVWTIIGLAFDRTWKAAGTPDFVLAALFTMVFLEALFACNTATYLMRLGKNRPVDTDAAIHNEWGKIILSFLAKTTLAWLVYGGLHAYSH